MTQSFNMMWYNTENFYDTVDDPEILDNEFTPDGALHWTKKRFNTKLSHLVRIVNDIVFPYFPDVIGLAEIENRVVMLSIADKLLANKVGNYEIIHYESPDERGADIGVLYNPNTLQVIEKQPILVKLPGIEDRTRDILYIKGKTVNNEIIHLFFTHFPSRREGTERSERRRYFVASELENAVQSVLINEPNAHIIISGDFNDTPDDNSVDEILGAQKEFTNIENQKLYNILYPRHKRGIGSTYHKKWMMFDQFLVSGSLLKSDKIKCIPENADIFHPSYLIRHEKGRAFPNRTYSGKYIGGYSDHLPIYLRMYLL